MGMTHSEYLRYSLFWFRIRDFMLNSPLVWGYFFEILYKLYYVNFRRTIKCKKKSYFFEFVTSRAIATLP